MSFLSLKYMNPEHTVIFAVDANGADRTIEPIDGAFWNMAINLEFGPIAAYVAPPPPPPAGADVDRERDRRVVAGVVVTVAGYGTVALQGRDMDQRNLHGLATAAQLRIAAGAGAAITRFRDRDNVIHDLTQAQILDLWSQGAAFVSAVFQSAWALKDGPSIPADFADDGYWP